MKSTPTERSMRVPVKPQPDIQLRARYAEALRPIYDVNVFMEPDAPMVPSSKPEHVFDTLDGLRLIVSRDRINGEIVTHFSGSFHEQCGEQLQKIRKVLSLDDALDFMVRRWREISGETHNPVELVHVTEGKGVPHWIVRRPH